MKTKYLDTGIETLNILGEHDMLSDWGKEILSELEQIKRVLSIDVSSETMSCVMSPECEIIRICINQEVAERVMKQYKDQHDGDWYIDDVTIEH